MAFIRFWVSIEPFELPQWSSLRKKNLSIYMPFAVILYFHLFRCSLQKRQAFSSFHTVNNKNIMEPQLVFHEHHFIATKFSLHIGFLFPYHQEKVMNCTRVPKPSIVPTYYTHCGRRGWLTTPIPNPFFPSSPITYTPCLFPFFPWSP